MRTPKLNVVGDYIQDCAPIRRYTILACTYSKSEKYTLSYFSTSLEVEL